MAKILYIFCLLLYSATIISEDTTTSLNDTTSTVSSSVNTETSTNKDPSTTISSTDIPASTEDTTKSETSTIESSSSESPTTTPTTIDSSTTISSTDTSGSTEDTTKTEPSTIESSSSESPTTTIDSSTDTSGSTEDTTKTETSTIVSSTSESPTTTPEPIPSTAIAERSFTWSSDDLSNGNALVIKTDEGYYISAKVSNVDMSDGNYLLLQEGDSDNPQSENRRIFTNTVQGPVAYLFLSSTVYVFCENTKPDPNNTQAEFTVVFERVGELTTTLPTTTSTTIIVPTTDKDDSTDITVNLSGRSLSEFEDVKVKETFQACLAQIAQNYCKQQNINVTQDITKQYVLISEITQCPYNWPQSSKCVQITFSLPIFYVTNSKWSGYQLNSENLEIMWLREDEFNSTCLYDNNFNDYDEPNFSRSIIPWAVGISLVIVLLVGILWFLRTFSSKLKVAIKKRQRKNSDSVSIMSKKSDSICSLTPHYLQDRLEVPKFFET